MNLLLPRNTCSWNVAGTKFQRLASRKLLGRWGTNLQNPSENILRIYIPDGYHDELHDRCAEYLKTWDIKLFNDYELSYLRIFVQCDQAGADALIVAYLVPYGNFRSLFLFGIKPHIFVALHIFAAYWRTQDGWDEKFLFLNPPELSKHPAWPFFAKKIKNDKRRYFIGKKCCHSFNYRMMPSTFRTDVLKESEGLVALTKLESEFYHETYHRLFPELSNPWWIEIESQLRQTRTLYNLFGYPLTFYGPFTPKLLREATAAIPASTVAVINNTAETELQDWIDENEECNIDLLNNKHDSLLVQCPIGEERFCAAIMRSKLERDLSSHRGERFRMKAEAKVGFNWGDSDESNPTGLVEISG